MSSASDLENPFWPLMFPGPPLSSDAIQEIQSAFHLADLGAKKPDDLYQDILDTLLEDQSRQGLRLHKGFPLYWLSDSIGDSDREKALNRMLEAFVEDILTHGHESLTDFAAASLRKDFGLTTETLLALKEFVLERVRVVFYPGLLVSEFLTAHPEQTKTKELFKGVGEEGRLDSILTKTRKKIDSGLRPIITDYPDNEFYIQDRVFALLREIDPLTDREASSGKMAGKESRVDFLMENAKIGVEVKLVRQGNKGSIVDDINADVRAYLKSLKRVVFVVYDASGEISDVSRFCAELKGDNREVEVVVIKH